MADIIYILFLFALGSCIGSFLNVVVWRLPQVEGIKDESLIAGFFRTMKALSDPPSHCPKCEKLLKWYDNIPVLGWLKLGGKCRYCHASISKRYPIIEAITGLMFVGYYVAFFMLGFGPCVHQHSTGIFFHVQMSIANYAWLYGLDMALLSGLLAASLIDAEFFIIPIEIPWIIALIAVVIHAWFDHCNGPGSTDVGALPAALAVGASLGCVISVILVKYKILPRSFAEGAPLLEVEREAFEEHRKQEQENAKKSRKSTENTSSGNAVSDEEREWSAAEIRREIRKEMLFLLIPLALGLLCVALAWKVEPIAKWWEPIARQNWVSTMLGSVLGGLVGGFTVWITRILGSYGFGREAMGMGDVDLMVAVGAVLGSGPAVTAFFFAPFFGIAVALYTWLFRQKKELPYGPYLSLATTFVMLFYCPIATYFTPGLSNLAWLLGRFFGG